MRIGLVGYGTGGQHFHAPFIAAAEGVILAGVVARAPATVARVEADLPGVPVFPSLTAMIEAGGIDAVVSALRSHGGSHAGVAEHGCWALRNLAVNADNQKTIAEAGGIEMILSVMKKHGASNAGVAKQGCGALWSLAANNAHNKTTIAAAGGIEIILSMKSTWPSNKSVKKNADGALRTLK